MLLFFVCISVSAQWIKTNGSKGITVTKFFEYNGILFCGTYAQGVYKSLDHGISWTASNTGIQNKQVMCFGNDALYFYAGTQDAGVYRSSDNGITWSPANTGIQTQAVKFEKVSAIRSPGFEPHFVVARENVILQFPLLRKIYLNFSLRFVAMKVMFGRFLPATFKASILF